MCTVKEPKNARENMVEIENEQGKTGGSKSSSLEKVDFSVKETRDASNQSNKSGRRQGLKISTVCSVREPKNARENMVEINIELEKSGGSQYSSLEKVDFSVKETSNFSGNEMEIKTKQGNMEQLNTNSSEKADETLEKVTLDESKSRNDGEKKQTSDSQCLQCNMQFRWDGVILL